MANPFDQFDGAAEPQQHSSNPFDQFDQPATFGQAAAQANKELMNGPDWDDMISQSSMGALLDTFGQGFKQGWGSEPLGIGDKTADDLKRAGVFNDYSTGRATLFRSFNEAVMRPTAAALDFAFNRLPMGVYHGLGDVAVAAGVPRDIVALPEAFPAGHLTGFPVRVMPPDIAQAADLGVIGKGEDGYRDLPAAQEAAKTFTLPSARAEGRFEPTMAAEATMPPDIHTRARQLAPDLFAEFDRLQRRRGAIQAQIDDLTEMRERGTSPTIEALDRRIDDLRGSRLEAPPVDRPALANQITALEDERGKLADALPQVGDTPEMAVLRSEMTATRERMWDLSPTVSDAYRRASTGELPAPTVPETPAAIPPEAPEVTPAPVAETATPPPAIMAAEAPAPSVQGGIATDISRQLMAAGRPAGEADAAAALVQAHYEARAARFGGAKGTAEDLYAADAPTVVASRNQRAVEYAQPGELEQARRGKIRLATDDAKATITLFKDADASTFLHETGHQWLEELIGDARDAQAPADLIEDARTVRDWLGVGDDEAISRRAHEKFARGFERYMMEGHAPSAALGNVFAKFREWLTRIYQTVSALRSPINDNIRRVFDRMLVAPGDAIAAPEPAADFAAIHRADAEHTPPEHAIDVADTMEAERERIAETAPSDIAAGRRDSRAATEAPNAEPGNRLSDRGGNEGQPERGPTGAGERPGGIGQGGGAAAPEGARVAQPAAGIDPGATGTNARFALDDGLIDKAGNIRLDNLNAPDNVDQVIRDAAARNNEFLSERRGVISDGQLLDLADALGIDPAFLDEKKIGAAFNAEEVLAARKLLVQSATAVRDAMVRAAKGSDADLAELARAITRHEMIQGKVSQATAEWGRAGRAFRNLDGWQGARDLNQFLKENTGRDLGQLRRMAELGQSLPTPANVSKFVADTTYGKVRQAIVYYWVNTLISGPITHLTYSVGNTINALWTPLVETPLAAVAGALRETTVPTDRVYLREATAQLYGLGKGFRDGLSAAVESYKTGVTPALPGERIRAQFLTPQTSPIPGPIGTTIGVPGRVVAGIHTFFKTIRYEQNIQALAMRDALAQGLEGNARDLHVARLSVSPTEDMMQRAVADALKELYMRPAPYNSFQAQLARAANSFLPAKIIAPFIKIGSEIVRNAFVERTALGLAVPEVRANLAMREGGAAFDAQLGKIMGGTGLMAAIAIGVLDGSVTGDGPSDPRERKVWMLTHKPNSVTIGPLRFSSARLGHLGMLARFAANMTETAGRWGDEDGGKLAHSFFDAIARSILDETWMRGVKDVFDAIYHPEEYFDRWLPRFIAQWSPFSIGLAQVARATDPYQRETYDLSLSNEIFRNWQASIPVYSRGLFPRRDVFGEPITTGSGTIDRYANDRVAQALDALHIGIAPVQKKIRGVPLTPQQYDDYQRLGGRQAKILLDQIVGPAFGSLPPETQIQVIREAVTKSHEAAAAQIMMSSSGGTNDIIKKATDAKLAALRGAKPAEVKATLTAH